MKFKIEIQTLTFSARWGQYFISIEIQNDVLTASLHRSDPLANEVTLQCELRFENKRLIEVYIYDLLGTGDHTISMCNKGYGTILVSSVFGFLRHHFAADSAKVSGEMSNAQSVNQVESHQRRVKFWTKMGVPPLNQENFNSRLAGWLGKGRCGTEPVIPPALFAEDVDARSQQHWQDSDKIALNQIFKTDLSISNRAEYEYCFSCNTEMTARHFRFYRMFCRSLAIILGVIMYLYHDVIAAILTGLFIYFALQTSFVYLPGTKKRSKQFDNAERLRQLVTKQHRVVKERIGRIEESNYGLLKRALHHFGLMEQLDKCNASFREEIIHSYSMGYEDIELYIESVALLKEIVADTLDNTKEMTN